jgi:hypothetical protein
MNKVSEIFSVIRNITGIVEILPKLFASIILPQAVWNEI